MEQPYCHSIQQRESINFIGHQMIKRGIPINYNQVEISLSVEKAIHETMISLNKIEMIKRQQVYKKIKFPLNKTIWKSQTWLIVLWLNEIALRDSNPTHPSVIKK